MNNIRTNIFEENERLRRELEQEKKLKNDWQNKYYELIKELKKTQQLLRQFLNENTPSSKLPFKYPNRKTENESKPRGKSPGSFGATKEDPEKIDKQVKAKLDKICPRCGKIIQKNEIVKQIRYVYDIIIKPKIIEVEEEFYYCDCGKLCLGKHPDVPEKGMIGYNLQSLFTELKHNFSGSYEKISKFTENITTIKFSPKTINNCLNRVAEKLESSYDELEKKMKDAKYTYSDETGWPVDGAKWWLWLFVTNNFTFITIQNSRARRVLLDIFGEDYQGVIISDCFKVYRDFAKWFQKCWVHLLRKAEYEAEKQPRKNIKKLYGQLKNLYEEMKDFLKGDPPPDMRLKMKKVFEKKLNLIINYKNWCSEAQSVVDNWLIAYRGHWLTAIEIPGVSLDNNICERGIRKGIGWRKMLGGHRTREGAKNYSIIETHRQTWKLQGKSPYCEMIEFLKNKQKCII